MPSDSSSNLKFEIGHVLFIDIVGYSKLLISEQSELLQTLKEIVRGTEQFRLAQAEGKLLPLPTGDGATLVFGPARRRRSCARWKSAGHLRVISNCRCAWGFTAARLTKSLI